MKIIIAGAYAIGSYLAKLLSRNNQDITLIDQNAEKLEKLQRDYDLLALEQSPTSPKALREANVQDCDLFIAVTPDETANLTCCTMAHALGARKTVAKIDNAEYAEPINVVFQADGHRQHHLSGDAGCQRHHQRTEDVVGQTALGCARRSARHAGH